MLLQFSVSNYRSFRDLQTLNLAASAHDKSLPGNVIESSAPGLTGKSWVKGVAIYGANASGKTTVIQALRALKSMVRNSAKNTDPAEPIRQIEPFALSDDPEPPTAFSISLIVENVRYEYRIAATRSLIWHESLRAFPKAKEQVWFRRDWSDETKSYTWGPDRPTGYKRNNDLERRTLSNVLFLSKTVAENQKELEPIFRWFDDHLNFLDGDLSFTYALEQINKKTPYCEQIVQILSMADLGLSGVRETQRGKDHFEKMVSEAFRPEFIEKLFGKDPIIPPIEPELLHRGVNGRIFPLPWAVQSAGTQRFFSLVGPWLDICRKGHTVLIDEIESSLHPALVKALLQTIFSEECNKGAQVIFTTHNPLLLDQTLLRRDQVWFTEKDQEGASHLYPLTDFKPRDNESLTRGYLAGRYGGVPFIPNGLLSSKAPEPAIA